MFPATVFGFGPGQAIGCHARNGAGEGRLQSALEKSSLAGRRGLGGRGEGADWGQGEVQALVMSKNGRQGLKQVNGRVERDKMDSRST